MKKRTSVYSGTHRHRKGESLASEADLWLNKALASSGFDRRDNPDLEQFKAVWRNMNESSRFANSKLYRKSRY